MNKSNIIFIILCIIGVSILVSVPIIHCFLPNSFYLSFYSDIIAFVSIIAGVLKLSSKKSKKLELKGTATVIINNIKYEIFAKAGINCIKNVFTNKELKKIQKKIENGEYYTTDKEPVNNITSGNYIIVE